MIAGVDYEESCCPVCGSADPDMDKHPGCMDALGTTPPRAWPFHDYDEEDQHV